MYKRQSWASLTDQLVRKFKDSLGINTTMKKFFIFVPVQTMKKMWANDSTGYTLVEPRHIRVPFVYRDYTHAADWPAPHFTLLYRGSARVYPAASFFVPKLYPAAPDLYPDQTGNRGK